MTFDAGDGNETSQITKAYGSSLTPPKVTWEGHTFVSWTPSVPTTTPGQDMTYTATWIVNTHTVTFDANGGTGGWSRTMNYGETIIPPTPTRTGHTFIGWNKEIETTVPDKDLTYIAQWKANSYTITFNANGGEGGWSKELEYGSRLEAPIVTRFGYTFSGWSPSVPSTVPASNKTYSANWTTNRYTVVFDLNYGDEITQPDTTREGYEFVGWDKPIPETMPAENVSYVAQWREAPEVEEPDPNPEPEPEPTPAPDPEPEPNPEPEPSPDPEPTPTPEPEPDPTPTPEPEPEPEPTPTPQPDLQIFTVTFNPVGGTMVSSQTSIQVEEGQQIGILPIAPNKNGYSFDGWFTEESGGTQISEQTIVTGNVTYYAHWTFQYIAVPVTNGEIRLNESRNTVIGYGGNPSEATIPNGVVTIRSNAFKNCISLQTVTLPNGLKTIGVSAFERCLSLR